MCTLPWGGVSALHLANKIAIDRGRRMIDCDSLLAQRFAQTAEAVFLNVERVQRRAIQQRAVDVHHRRVKAIRGKQSQAVAGVEVQVVRVRANEVQNVAVVLHHALRLSGRT